MGFKGVQLWGGLVVPVSWGWADVGDAWADEAVVGVLFHDVGTPAGDSGGDEDWGILGDGDAHGEVGHAAGEVDIWVDCLFVFHNLLDGFAEVEELDEVIASCFCCLASESVEDRCAVVAVFVDAVTEAHELAFFFECFVHPIGDFGGVVFWADV